jgi:hypothetical protein
MPPSGRSLSQAFEALIATLNERRVRYAIVGGGHDTRYSEYVTVMAIVGHNDLSVLSGFYFLSDQQRQEIKARLPDPDDEDGVKDLLACFIAPRLRQIERKRPGYLEELRNTLQYYLTTRRFPVEDTYYAEEPIIDHPSDPIRYYEWAWEVIFRGQSWELTSLAGFTERTQK